MFKGIELTQSQIKAYENGATMFLIPITLKELKYEHNRWWWKDTPDTEGADCFQCWDDEFIPKFSPVQKGDKDIFIKEEFKIGYWNSKTYQMAFDYRIGKNTELKYQNVEPFNKMVENSIKQLKVKNIKPDKYGNYKWEKYNSPLDWYKSSEMTKDQSRYSLSECIDVQIIKPDFIAKTGYFGGADLKEDILKCLGLRRVGYMSKECYEETGLKLFVDFYNQQLKEQKINRTYNDNDYIFLAKFKR